MKAEKTKLYRRNQREIGVIRPKLLGDMGGYDFSIRKYTECARVTGCGDRGNSAFFVVDARTDNRELQLNISHNWRENLYASRVSPWTIRISNWNHTWQTFLILYDINSLYNAICRQLKCIDNPSKIIDGFLFLRRRLTVRDSMQKKSITELQTRYMRYMKVDRISHHINF